jgi:hypothetical protein
MSNANGTATATASRSGTFALVFGICFAILYVVCDMASLPMFTYHPGTDRIDLGLAPPRRDDGPAMYCYGWIATSALGASILACPPATLPENPRQDPRGAGVDRAGRRRLPVLIYSLKFYWRWE